MAVDVERDRDLGVPQSLADDFGVDSGLEKERGGGVPQVVEADALEGVRPEVYACSGDGLCEGPREAVWWR